MHQKQDERKIQYMRNRGREGFNISEAEGQKDLMYQKQGERRIWCIRNCGREKFDASEIQE